MTAKAARPAVELEILPVYRERSTVFCVTRPNREALTTEWQPGEEPSDLVEAAVKALGFVPLVVHSTSWRCRSAITVVLTHIVAVQFPCGVPEGLSSFTPAGGIARGDALRPPDAVTVHEVAGHALRHLAWLRLDDPAVRDALGEWGPAMAPYEPCMFERLSDKAGQ